MKIKILMEDDNFWWPHLMLLDIRSEDKHDIYALAARNAIRCYADVIASENKKLAYDLRMYVKREDEQSAML